MDALMFVVPASAGYVKELQRRLNKRKRSLKLPTSPHKCGTTNEEGEALKLVVPASAGYVKEL